MANFNICTFSGRLGKDPTMSYTDKGLAVTKFTMASSYWDGKVEQTNWLNYIAFDKMAERIVMTAMKGTQATISGQYRQRKYTDKNGVDQTWHEYVVGVFEPTAHYKIVGKDGREYMINPNKGSGQSEGPVTVTEAPVDYGDPNGVLA